MKNTYGKKCIAGVIFMAAMIMYGCGDNQDRWTEQAEKMLEERYQETFQVVSIGESYGSVNNSTYTAVCAPSDNENCLFEACVEKEGKYMLDGYISALVCSQIENGLKTELDGMAGHYYIHVGAFNDYSDTEDVDITLAEYMELYPESKFAVYMAVDVDQLKIYEDSLRTAIQNGLHKLGPLNGFLEVSILPGEKVDQLESYMQTHADADAGFIDVFEEGSMMKKMNISQGVLE